MKISEKFYGNYCERAIINHKHILDYGNICFLEGKLELVEDSGHDTVKPMIEMFKKQLNEISKKYNLD